MGESGTRCARWQTKHVECACGCVRLCAYGPLALLAQLVSLGADVALRAFHGGFRRPTGRCFGHVVDELHLDGVGHAVEGFVLTPHMEGLQAVLECPPLLVSLVPHRRLLWAVSLFMHRDNGKKVVRSLTEVL